MLTLRERDFVSAARVMGATRRRIVLRHLIPNALSVVIVNVTFQVADSILILAYIGFLGFGLQFPATSWGDMLGGAQNYVTEGYWWLVYPVGGCLVVLVLATQPGRRRAPRRVRRAAETPLAWSARCLLRSRSTTSRLTSSCRAATVQAVGNVSLGIETHETVGLVGESGCGKSMLGLSILGLLPNGGHIIEGSIKLGGRELVGLRERRAAASCAATRWR